MMKTYREDVRILTKDCDLTGQWKPSAILEVMQELAGIHGTLIGVGRNALLQQGVVWVLTRVEVVMDRYPKIGDTVSIETFPMPVRRWFFPRYFIFRNEQGEEIGRAGSLWVLLDVNTRKMAKPDICAALMPDNSDLLAPLGLPATVTEVSGTLETGTHIPVYTDLDINGHVNNTKYMDWCCNALGIDTMKTHCLSRFDVNYNLEILPGQEIRSELRRLSNEFSFSGFNDSTRHFDVGGTLRERE
ncbi:MAG: hypothetical protein J6M20_12885 [Clostridia bacterium]|nr:hypothetical protein [Clostridia bacterium]MBQ7845150.1 hypothetical protein [Clostridia bacterium]